MNIENGGCKKCYGNIKRTMSDFHDMIDSRGGNIKILSEFYQNDKRVLHLLCMEDECKHDWVTTVAIFSSGSGCPKCARRKMSGVNSPVWNPLLTDEERVIKRQYSEYQNFIKESLIKNDFTCDISKQRGGQLEVHHLNGYHWYKEGRLDFNNIVVLSKDIHKEFHTLFGRGYNTIEQYIEFKNIKLDEMEKI